MMKQQHEPPMPAGVKAIQKLLAEESQIKADLANTALTWTGIHNGHGLQVRIQLLNRLFQVKAKLNLYSEHEIKLAHDWEKLKEQIKQSVYRLSGNLSPEKSKSAQNDNFLLELIFFYLLLNNKPMQAFLSLSLGWNVLFLENERRPRNPRSHI